MKKLLWISSFSYLATGFSHVLIGSILAELLGHYGGTYSEGGGLVFAQFFGFMLGVSAVGPIVQRIGRRTALTTAFAVMAAAQVYAVTLPAWELLLGILFMMGFAFGAIESSIGALILLAYKERQASAMGKLELYFGLGALIMPFISGLFLYADAWRYAFLPLGVLAVTLAAAWKWMDFGPGTRELLNRQRTLNHESEAPSPAAGRSRYGILSVFAVFFFLYVGLEVCLIEFAPSWMKTDYAVNPSAAAWIVTLYWLTMSVGRALIGALAERLTYRRYLVASSLGSMASIIGLAVASAAWMAYGLMALLGFTMAGIFAVALIYANSLVSGREQLTTSLLISAGGIGASVMPLVLGRWMDRFGMSSSIWLLAAASAVMLAIILATPAFVRLNPTSDSIEETNRSYT